MIILKVRGFIYQGQATGSNFSALWRILFRISKQNHRCSIPAA